MYAHEVINGLYKNLNPNTNLLFDRVINEIKFDRVINEIKIAQKFHFYNLSELLKSFERSMSGKELFIDDLSNCMFPYDLCWFDGVVGIVDNGVNELLEKDFWNKKNIKFDRFTKQGYLIKRIKETKMFIIYMFTETINSNWLLSPFQHVISIGKTINEYGINNLENILKDSILKDSIIENVKNGVKGNVYSLCCAVNPQTFEPMTKYLSEGVKKVIANDNITDLQILNAMLLLLSCKNIATEDVLPPEKVNKKRRKNNKTELFTYKVLKIKTTNKNQTSQANNPLYHNRLHLCRGHFKQYFPTKPLFGKFCGLYWWEPHIRGKNRNGIVIKDYEICNK